MDRPILTYITNYVPIKISYCTISMSVCNGSAQHPADESTNTRIRSVRYNIHINIYRLINRVRIRRIITITVIVGSITHCSTQHYAHKAAYIRTCRINIYKRRRTICGQNLYYRSFSKIRLAPTKSTADTIVSTVIRAISSSPDSGCRVYRHRNRYAYLHFVVIGSCIFVFYKANCSACLITNRSKIVICTNRRITSQVTNICMIA